MSHIFLKIVKHYGKLASLLVVIDVHRLTVVGKDHHHESHRGGRNPAGHDLDQLQPPALDVGHPKFGKLGVEEVPEGPGEAAYDGDEDKHGDLRRVWIRGNS